MIPPVLLLLLQPGLGLLQSRLSQLKLCRYDLLLCRRVLAVGARPGPQFQCAIRRFYAKAEVLPAPTVGIPGTEIVKFRNLKLF